ncbi:MAG TPA: four helix bundle protein [Candidatus Omnitrophota bacterium]|nr:four helix bundle protein [Candidatus Omnitrophota bacterium]
MERKFDLEERTTNFAKGVIQLCRELPRDPINDRLMGQVVGSAGSVGANYREANDALGKKDFLQKIKIARREAKETQHWLTLIAEANAAKRTTIVPLIDEVVELKKILSSIAIKLEK